MADRAPTVDGLEAVASERVRDAVARWAKSRATGNVVRHAVELAEDVGSGPVIAIREESSGAACAAELWQIEIPGDIARAKDGGPIPLQVLAARSLGPDCCGGAGCAARTPRVWMMRVLGVISRKDRDGARDLVGPEGLSIVTRCSGDGCFEDGESRETLRPDKVDARALEEATGGLSAHDEISCEDGAETFACHAHGGGYEGAFEWKRLEGRAVLTEIRTRGH